MAYGTPADLIAEYGEAEIARLTTPEGESLDGVVMATAERALATASDTIDSYLRRRYVVPLPGAVPLSIRRVCLLLARYDLAHGRGHVPTEQMRLARKDELTWLGKIGTGDVTLDGLVASQPAGGDAPMALATDRERIFTDESLRGW